MATRLQRAKTFRGRPLHTENRTTRIEIGDTISIEGPTLEVVLWLSGREATNLTFHGPLVDIDRLRERLRV